MGRSPSAGGAAEEGGVAGIGTAVKEGRKRGRARGNSKGRINLPHHPISLHTAPSERSHS